MLSGLCHTYVVAKEKLFPSHEKAPDKRAPHDKFSDFAAKIVTVSKSEFDEREKEWHRDRKQHKE